MARGLSQLAAADLELLPTDDEVRAYRERGWYLSKKLLTEDEVDRLVEASDRYYAGHRDRRLPTTPPRIAYWKPEDGDVTRHNDYVFNEDDVVREVLSKPVIAAVAARLARTDQIRLWNSTLIYKPPRPNDSTAIIPWHMDRHYWSTCTSDDMLTAWVPFHDCDEVIGTITMVDGSNRWTEVGAKDSTTRHFKDRDTSELDALLEDNARANGDEVRKVPMLIPRGHMSFHSCLTYHGSGNNRSSRPRQAISFHLQDRKNQWRPFRLSDDSLLTYNHDVLVRRTADGHPDYSDPTFCPVLWEGTI